MSLRPALGLRRPVLAHRRRLAPLTSPLTPALTPALGPGQRRNLSVYEVLHGPVTAVSDLLLTVPTPSYALSIVVLTVLLRSTITVPFTLWQRRRVRRTRELIVPEMKRVNDRLAVELVAKSRREGTGYEGYVRELKKAMADHQFALHKKHRTHPMITLALPLAVHIPVLITTSLAIRHALEVPGSAMAAESVLWLTSLGEVDPVGALPLIGALLAMSNAEVAGRKRKKDDKEIAVATAPSDPDPAAVAAAERAERQASSTSTPSSTSSSSSTATPAVASPRPTAAPPRTPPQLSAHLRKLTTSAPAPARPRTRAPVKLPRSQIPTTTPTATRPRPNQGGPAAPGADDFVEDASEAKKVEKVGEALPMFMRAMAVAFIPIGATMPSAVVLYWTTSMTFSLVQNLVLTRIDERDRAQRLAKRAALRAARDAERDARSRS